MARSRSAAAISIATISSMVSRGLPGIQRETTIAPTTARPGAAAGGPRLAATDEAAAGGAGNRPAGPRCWAAAWVAVIEVPAAFLADSGSLDRVGLSELRYACARIDPSTATLSATATWRAVLDRADPAPARSRGRACMMLAVAAGMATPSPAPWMK